MSRIHVVQIVAHELLHVTTGYQEVIETLLWGLQDIGHETSFSVNKWRPDALNIILGAQSLSLDLLHMLPRNTIIYNLEQSYHVFEPINEGDTPHPMREGYHYMRKNFTFWDYSGRNVNAMATMESDKPVKHVPIGFCPILQKIKKAETQDIDILFYGTAGDHRISVFQKLCLHWHKCIFACGIYGPARDELISRSKIVLNISGGPESAIFAVVRASYLLANRKLVVADLQPLMHIERDMVEAVKFAKPDQVVSLCHLYLANDAAREEAEEKGFEIMARRDIRAILLAALA